MLRSVGARHGQLALHERTVELARRFDFDEPLVSIAHFDQKVGDDVRTAFVSCFLPRCGWSFPEQPDLWSLCRLAPGVPNGTGLFLDRNDGRAG